MEAGITMARAFTAAAAVPVAAGTARGKTLLDVGVRQAVLAALGS
jgi:hypothetical protein